MNIEKLKIFLFVLVIAAAAIWLSYGNDGALENIKEKKFPKDAIKHHPVVFSNTKSNLKVKEGYIIKVFRNDQLEYPIFFTGLQTSIWFEENKPESAKFSAAIEASSIQSGNEEMDAHAKEQTVLDAELFPLIVFESTSVKKIESGYEATGNLKMKGIIKEIKMPFVFRNDTFSGKFEIGANDFAITRDGASSGIIKIELTIPVTK